MIIKGIRHLEVIFLLILKKKAESRLIEGIMLTLLAPMEEWLVHKENLLKVSQTEGESIVTVILRGKRGITFQESLVANTVI